MIIVIVIIIWHSPIPLKKAISTANIYFAPIYLDEG